MLTSRVTMFNHLCSDWTKKSDLIKEYRIIQTNTVYYLLNLFIIPNNVELQIIVVYFDVVKTTFWPKFHSELYARPSTAIKIQ